MQAHMQNSWHKSLLVTKISGEMKRRTGELACQQSPSCSAAKGDDLPTALLNTPSSCHHDCTCQLAGWSAAHTASNTCIHQPWKKLLLVLLQAANSITYGRMTEMHTSFQLSAKEHLSPWQS